MARHAHDRCSDLATHPRQAHCLSLRPTVLALILMPVDLSQHMARRLCSDVVRRLDCWLFRHLHPLLRVSSQSVCMRSGVGVLLCIAVCMCFM
jgi:hypothetical protein